jgi:hypothetical protein
LDSESESERGPRLFMYEDAWRREESYEKAVIDSWQNGSGVRGLACLQEALSQMQVGLST